MPKKGEIIKKLDSDINELDLSRDEDLSIGIMNLISLEEHLFFTHQKTGSEEALEMLSEVRKIRTSSMKEIVENKEGEEWCISKHLLAAAMRFRESGDKMLDRDREKAEKFYEQAYSIYSMFWALNLETEGTESKGEKKSGKTKEDGNSFISKAKGLVTRSIDCCK